MLKELQIAVEKGLSIFDDPIVHCIFVTFVALYAGILAPRLPSVMTQIVNSTFFKIVFFFIVVLLAQKDPRIALIVSLGYIFTLQALSKFSVQDQMVNASQNVSAENVPRSVTDNAVEVSLVDDATDSDILDKPYQVTDETEVVAPLHDAEFHSGPQALGQPITGYEDDSLDKHGAPW